jgi:hypothetical protein
MRILKKRIAKIHNEYDDITLQQRLRLTDKRIKELERERIANGESFDAAYMRYRNKRIGHNTARIAKKLGVDFETAIEIRSKAIDGGTTYADAAEFVEREREIIGDSVSAFDIRTQRTYFFAFYDLILNLKVKYSPDKTKQDPDVLITFGDFVFDGKLSGVDMKAIKEYGNEVYGEDSPPWGWYDNLVTADEYYPSKQDDALQKLIAVIKTLSTEEINDAVVIVPESGIKNM